MNNSAGEKVSTVGVDGIILFGDSVLAGTGASDRQLGCGKLIKDQLEIPVSIRSRNRDTSEFGLKRISEDVLAQQKHSHVLVLFGNNDCWVTEQLRPAISIKNFEKNLIEISRLIQRNSKQPLLCNLQPIENTNFFESFPEYQRYRDSIGLDPYKWQAKYSQRIERVSEILSLPLIDIRTPLLNSIGVAIANDGLHPNDLGHSIIAKKILEVLGGISKQPNSSRFECQQQEPGSDHRH